MKRKLLYVTTVLLFSVSSIKAQTSKVWNFGADSAIWGTANTAMASGTNVIKDGLGLYSGASVTSFGAVQSTTATFTDAFVGTAAFKLGGAGYSGTTTLEGTGYLDPNNNFLPEQRFVHFNVTGPCTIKVWFRTSSSGNARSAIVTDGISFKAFATTTGNEVLTANYTGGSGKIYIYSDVGANFFKIEVIASGSTGLGTTTTLGIDNFQADASSNVYSNGKSVFVSNVKSDTQVDVYGISGVLVKSFKTGADTSFDLNTGLYVVRSKSAEGEKTAKVLVN